MLPWCEQSIPLMYAFCNRVRGKVSVFISLEFDSDLENKMNASNPHPFLRKQPRVGSQQWCVWFAEENLYCLLVCQNNTYHLTKLKKKGITLKINF